MAKRPKFPAGRRPASRGGSGGQRPPDTIIHYNRKIRRSARASPPANGRPAGGVQGGQRPPAQHFITTIIIIIIIIIINYDNYQLSLSKSSDRMAKRPKFPAGRRPASRGGSGGQRSDLAGSERKALKDHLISTQLRRTCVPPGNWERMVV